MAHVTNHATERAHERVGLPKRAINRTAQLALERGAKHGDFSGSFKRYLDGVFLQHHTANNMRVFGGNLYLFDGDTLITVWAVPQKFRKQAGRA